MNSHSSENQKKQFLYWVVITLSIGIGIIIRFKGLGKWPLALDEYYIIKSAENILKYGLPQLPQGGYYDRGILIQYIISFLLFIGIKAEFAGRIISLIFNIVTIIPLYKLSNRIGGKFLALLTIIIFSFSIWEIEFSRFARMYAPFQAIFTYYIYLSFVDYKEGTFTNYKWMLILSGISILIYEGSIFLAVFNFIPFFVKKQFKFKYVISAVVMFFISFILNRINFRNINAGEIFPPEYYNLIKESSINLPLRIPEILAPYSFSSALTLILVLCLILVNVFLFWKLYSNIRGKNLILFISLALLGISLLFNQFGFFIISFSVIILWNFIGSEILKSKNLFLVGILFVINIIFWYLFGITTNNWFELFNNFSSYSLWGISKRLFVAFFNYPNNYYSLLNYFQTLPLLTVFSSISLIALLTLILLRKVIDKNLNYLFGVLIFLAALASVPKLLYQETRYTFFIIPIVIILVAYTINKISFIISNKFSTIISTLVILTVFYFSNDFNFYHIYNIDKEEVNYRIIYNPKIKNHLYRRWDIQSPINYVKKNIGENDLIIINENSLEYYLPKVDYFNFNYRHSAFPALSANSGNTEKWSGSKLIYKNDDLVDLIETRQNAIWYLVFPEFWLKEINFGERYKDYLVYEGVDSLIKVYRFPN